MKGFYPAIVKNNNDTKKKGRVQIKIEHLHYNIADEFLPWAIQSNASIGSTNEYGSSFIPENNSHIWVWFEDIDEMYRQPYYIADVHFSNKHPHNLFENNIKQNLTSSSVYPNTKYTYYPNGICIGVDSNVGNPEIFLYHPGAYIFINKDGEIHLKSGSGDLESSILGETLKMWLESHTHTTGVGPSGPPIEAPDLINILSPQIKSN